MSGLVIYSEDKNNLTPINFLKDAQNHLKIRDIDVNSIEFRKELGSFFTRVNNLIGIKEKISDINKTDIKGLILMRFKALSLNEIDYAFKLERYGEYDSKTEHFQLFNAEYVGEILSKYLKWKELKRRVHNIKLEKDKKLISESELTKINNNIILNFLNKYESEYFISDELFYIYDILDNKNLMNKDVSYKKSVQKDAIYVLKIEYSKKEALNRKEVQEIKNSLSNISKGIGGELKKKCKILCLEEFFRNLYKNKEEVSAFKNNFKIVNG